MIHVKLCFIHKINPFSIETFELVEEETATKASVFSNGEIINRFFYFKFYAQLLNSEISKCPS